MLLVLQKRLLTILSPTSILYTALHSDCAGLYQHHSLSPVTPGQSKRLITTKDGRDQPLGTGVRAFQTKKLSVAPSDDGHGIGVVGRNWPDTPQARARLPEAQESDNVKTAELSQLAFRPNIRLLPATQHDALGSNLNSGIRVVLPSEATRFKGGWRCRLVTFEQYEYESNFEAPISLGRRLVDSLSNAQDWTLWLELIAFRKRHHGAKGTIAIFKEMFRRELRLPTEGIIADQLWDLLIQTGVHDSGLLEEIVVYAIRLKSLTRRSWSNIYYGIISTALKEDPNSAYNWHVKIRDDLPPSLTDYQKIFKLAVELGRSAHFRDLFLDSPLLGMYQTVIGQFCELQMYAEALKWHELLCQAGDFPTEFTDIQPLLDHLVYIGDRPRFDKIVTRLAKTKVGDWNNVAEDYAQRDTAITREIMNRHLGEVHGIAPKTLSDSFCARLFATQFFSVDTIIRGLHMVAAEVIGPLSLREIAVRDNCDAATICHHIDILKHAGISLDNSMFCTIIRRLAVENKGGILKSIVNCDLHPDTFADYGLQERLLAQYYEANDLVQIERTLAVLTTGYSVQNLQTVLMNLILRSQVTLGRREKVLAILAEMKHKGIAVSARSSRHLRVCWLSRRQVGRGPRETQELTILIQASQMTMQSGRFVPIIAWREILRRLGMAGRLQEVENLALWLVDWYSSPAAKAALPKRVLLSTRNPRALDEDHMSSEESPDPDPNHYLNTLFTTSARHAIVAWGFQQTMKSRRSIRRFTQAQTIGDRPRLEGTPRFQWTWGLHLLYKLREHGLPLHKGEVARICRHRLNTLFGTRLSKRPVNRRAWAENSYSESVYVRKMEEIWGVDLFRVWSHDGKSLKKRKEGWRRRRHGVFRVWRPVGMKKLEKRVGGIRYPNVLRLRERKALDEV